MNSFPVSFDDPLNRGSSWWSEDAKKNIAQHSKCLMDQYNSYSFMNAKVRHVHIL